MLLSNCDLKLNEVRICSLISTKLANHISVKVETCFSLKSLAGLLQETYRCPTFETGCCHQSRLQR